MTRKNPDAGELLDFEILTGGDVLLTVSDIEDRYGHPVTITAAELAGMAEASAARREGTARIRQQRASSHTWPETNRSNRS